MNIITISGRVVQDAQLTTIGNNNTDKLSFSLAVEREYQPNKNDKVVDFINVELLGGTRAKNISSYILKGKALIVTGELNIDRYKTKEGNNAQYIKVKANRIEFIGGNNNKNEPMVTKEIKEINKMEYIEINKKNEQINEPLNDEDIPF